MKSEIRIVSIGEVLWDLFPDGARLGGAPANFACHCQSLGARVSLVSAVGRDALGDEAWRRLSERGVDVSCVRRLEDRPTGTVEVDVDPWGKPVFRIREGVAWDALDAGTEAKGLVQAAQAVCFGTLAQRTETGRRAVHELVATASEGALRVCDINLRKPFVSADVIRESLGMADVLKLNEDELPELAAQFGLEGTAEDQVRVLAERFGLRVVVLTLGELGSCLLREGEWSREPARAVRVVDTVGAGDAFTAVLVMGLLKGWPTPRLLQCATEVAAYVCTQAGATPDLESRDGCHAVPGIFR
jgi:fructokinase